MVHSSLDDGTDDSSHLQSAATAAATGDATAPNHAVDDDVTRPDGAVDSELVARASGNAETTTAVSAAAVAAAVTSTTSITSQSLPLDAQVVSPIGAAAAALEGHEIDVGSTTTTTTTTTTSHGPALDWAVRAATAATAATANAANVTSDNGNSSHSIRAGVASTSMDHSAVASSPTELAVAALDDNDDGSVSQFGVSNVMTPVNDEDIGLVPSGHATVETTTRAFYKQAFLPAVGTDEQQQQQEYGSLPSRPNLRDDISGAFYKQALQATNDMAVVPVSAAAAAATRVQVDDAKRGPDRGNDGTNGIADDLNVNSIDKQGINLLLHNAAQTSTVEFEAAAAPMVVPVVPVYDGDGHLVLALPIQAVHGEAVSTEAAIVPREEAMPTEDADAVTATSRPAVSLQASVTSDQLPNREAASTEMSNEASRHGTEALPMTVAQRFRKALSQCRCKGIVAMFALVVTLIAAVSTGFCLGTSSCAKKSISRPADVTLQSSPTVAPAPSGQEVTAWPSVSKSQAPGVPTAATLQPAASAERAIQITRFINNVTLTGTSIAFHESIDSADDVTAEEIALHWLITTDVLQLVPNTSANRFQLQQRYALATLWAQLPIGWSPAYQTRGHECEWAGILCNSTPGDSTSGAAQVVTAISWNGTATMQATISAELGLLSSLVHFAVRPGLFGSIPSTIGLWTYLEYLDMSQSILSGALPESIGRWSNLKHFDISDSALSGALPESIQEWSNLEFFDVSECLFALSFEPMRQWSNLKHFDIGYNLLSGTLPDDIGQWTSMQHFDINGNSLSGIVPSSIGKWTDVQYFAVDYNSLTGPLPLFSEQWTSMEYFNVYGNTFTGILPEFIADWVNLKYFDVSRSALNGTLSDDLGQWTNLEHFDIGENRFVGSMPESFDQWTLLEFFAAYANTLTGSIPAGVSNWTNVRHFDVGFNSLSGNIPNAIGQWTALEHFDVSTNFLNGTLPEYAQWPELQYFNVGDNALNGTLPVYFANSTSLEEATFYLNDFSGTVPREMCNVANLTYLYVDCPNIECGCCTECPEIA